MNRIFLMVACAILLAACGPDQPGAANAPGNTPAPDEPRSTMPDDFEISVGEGGGFTGAWHWKHVAADGSVRHDDTPGGKIDRKAREAIWAALQTLLAAEFERGPDNMTSAVRYSGGGKEGYVDTPFMPTEGPFADFTTEFNRVLAKAVK
jgi:hypothetical protein